MVAKSSSPNNEKQAWPGCCARLSFVLTDLPPGNDRVTVLFPQLLNKRTKLKLEFDLGVVGKILWQIIVSNESRDSLSLINERHSAKVM